jgi:hypothetical protein
MSENIVVNGSLSVGPANAADAALPSGSMVFQLASTPNPKPSQAQDKGSRAVASSLSFVTLGSVGAGGNVTQGDTLLVISDAPVQLRLTMNNPLGSDEVSTVELQGMLLLEFPPAQYLKLLEVKGTANVEYFVSGQS